MEKINKITSLEEYLYCLDNSIKCHDYPRRGYRALCDEVEIHVWYELLKIRNDFSTKYNMIHNVYLQDEMMELLAQDSDPEVRWRLAMDDYLPNKLIKSMADDEHPSVRNSIASHERVPMKILIKLAADENDVVKHGAAFNDRLPDEILVSYIDSENEYLKETAIERVQKRCLDIKKIKQSQIYKDWIEKKIYPISNKKRRLV